MQEQDRRIHDPELAHHMAYAEKPFRDLAEQVIRLGMAEAHDEALRRANAASVIAGKEYLSSLQASIGFYEKPTKDTLAISTADLLESTENLQAELEEDDGPEYMTVSQMRRSFGVGYDVAKAAVEKLRETLGEVAQTEFSRGGRGRRSGELIEIFNREQRAKIADYLREQGNLTIAPDDYMSLNGIANKLGVGAGVISRVMEIYGDTVGSGIFGVKRGQRENRSGAPRPLYSPGQQERIAATLNLDERPPESYKGIYEISASLKKLGLVGATNLDRAVKRGSIEELGEPYRFSIIKGDEPMTLYSPEQQARILQHLQKRFGNVVKPGDEASYASRHAMAKEFGVPKSSVASIIEEYATVIGEPELVQFGSRITTGYSVAQREIIHALLQDTGRLQYAYPKGFLPASMILPGVRATLPEGTTKHQLFKEAVVSIPNLGAVVTSVDVNNRSFALYSPKQQTKIIAYIKARAKTV
jgi:hypothetical protein